MKKNLLYFLILMLFSLTTQAMEEGITTGKEEAEEQKVPTLLEQTAQAYIKKNFDPNKPYEKFLTIILTEKMPQDLKMLIFSKTNKVWAKKLIPTILLNILIAKPDTIEELLKNVIPKQILENEELKKQLTQDLQSYYFNKFAMKKLNFVIEATTDAYTPQALTIRLPLDKIKYTRNEYSLDSIILLLASAEIEQELVNKAKEHLDLNDRIMLEEIRQYLLFNLVSNTAELETLQKEKSTIFNIKNAFGLLNQLETLKTLVNQLKSKNLAKKINNDLNKLTPVVKAVFSFKKTSLSIQFL